MRLRLGHKMCEKRALPFTTFAAEGKEVQLAAKGHLAVGADCFYIAGGHLAEGLGLSVRVCVL